MADLPDTWMTVLNILLEGPVAWRSPAEVAKALGRNDSETTDLLSDLNVAGLVAVWETDSGPLVILSALAAERLSARLVEVGPEAIPRWALVGEPDPPAPRSKNVCRSARAAALDTVADCALWPDAAEEFGERADRFVADRRDSPPAPVLTEDWPKPTHLIGVSLSPWPGPSAPVGAGCPACGGRKLGPRMYCLLCDRWGLDALLENLVTHPLAEPSERGRRPRPQSALDQLQDDRLRSRRQEKRRVRQEAMTEADRRRKPVRHSGKSLRSQTIH